MREILKEKGYKATPARLAILEIFTRSKTPVSSEGVCRALKRDKSNKRINEATVYRTLTSFVEDNILKRIDWRKESAYFELADEHHHHMTCVKCDTVEDFESVAVEKAVENIIKKSSKFKIIREHSLELFGLCAKCA